MLDDLKYISQKDSKDMLGARLRALRDTPQASFEKLWSPDVPTKDNEAKQAALECMGRGVVVIAHENLRNVAESWVQAINVQAHSLAFTQIFSDSAEQIYQSWLSMPVHKIYSVVILHEAEESPAASKEFDQLQRKLSGQWPEPIEISGDSEYVEALGDVVAIYLAIANNTNPAQMKSLH